MKKPNTNMLSIFYARSLVIDVGVIEKLRVFRSDGHVEAIINIEGDSENNGLNGILVCPATFIQYSLNSPFGLL